MENPFKKLESTEQAPPGLEKKVMSSVNLSQLIINMSDLFVVKMGETLGGLFKIGDSNDQKS